MANKISRVMLNAKSVMTLLIVSVFPLVANAQLYGDKYPSFIPQDSMPHFEYILPAPPDTCSLNFFNDYVQYQWGKSIRHTERGEQARIDAELEDFQVMLNGFADAFGMQITQEDTPEMYNLLYWAKNDAANSTYRLKKQGGYRKRPYVQFMEGTLVPESEEHHRASSSYPSNHSAAGWGVALVLIELNPARQDEILKRGYEYGQSRVIAGYHYQSDVDAGRFAASAAIALINRQPFFQKQLAKAMKEYEKILKKKK